MTLRIANHVAASDHLDSPLRHGRIGNAKVAGLQKELGISSPRYQLLLTAYYLGYIPFQWMLLLWKPLGARNVVAVSMIGLGACSICQGAANNWATLFALRFLIGVFEAGYIPGVSLYFSQMYTRQEFGFRYAVFIVASSFANAWTGVLSFGLQHAKASISAWRLLLIVEASPTIILAVFAWIFIPNSIATARFLNDRERKIAAHRCGRLAQMSAVAAEPTKRHGWSARKLLSAFADVHLLGFTVAFFFAQFAFASLPVFLPTIIKEIGYTGIQANGLSAPPYVLAIITATSAAWFSDRAGVRGPFIIAFSSLALIGYALLATLTSTAGRYVCCWLIVVGVQSTIPLLFTWVGSNSASDAKRGASFVCFGMIGQVGPIVGVYMYPDHEAPYYRRGMSVNAACFGIVIFIASILSIRMFLLNRSRDRKYGKTTFENGVIPHEVAEQGNSHPSFRFTP